MIKIKKGLNIPIKSSVPEILIDAPRPKSVAILGPDYNGMKPSFKVKVGDSVSAGDHLFSDKEFPDIHFTSPVQGKVTAINRGEKRVFQSVVITVTGQGNREFSNFRTKNVADWDSREMKKLLLESGLWTSLRTRPFSRLANPEKKPRSLFVTAMDTNPLAICPTFVIDKHLKEFETGLKVLKKVINVPTYLCHEAGKNMTAPDEIELKSFSGPHPAGNVGTHIHFVDPVGKDKEVWHIGYQDVIAIGHFFQTGKLFATRYLSLAGPAVHQERIIKTVRGANLEDVVAGHIKDGHTRIVSGSLLSGRRGRGAFSYLGHFHNQISIIFEGTEREFLGWLGPGFDKFSVTRTFLSKLIPNKKFNFTANLNGSLRAVVPIGSYDKIMPLDIVPVFLLRALMAGDTDRAQELGCLELDEEDLALCSFVSPSKINYGTVLRDRLIQIEKEG